MVVSVNFHGLQRKVTRANQIQISLSKETRVTDVLRRLQECYPELALNEDAVAVTVNNQVTSLDQILEANDKISFIPHIGGG